MDKNKLVRKVKEIQMPTDMQQRIIENCYYEMEEKKMSTTKKFFQKPVVIVATFVFCLCFTGVSVLAGTSKLEGFFKDIMRWDGAVIGTFYEQATHEVEINVCDVSKELVVEITILNLSQAPYYTFESFSIAKYKIIDKNGNVVVENEILESSSIKDGKVNIGIPLGKISAGEYKLVVSELIGSSKADQPLVLSGTWECEFVY